MHHPHQSGHLKGSTWYLVAGTDAGRRTFRVGRVRSVERTDDPVERPEGFDLNEAWREIMTTLDDRRAPYRVAARAERDMVRILRSMFGTRLTVGDELDDGRVEVEMRGHSEWVVAAEIAGFGDRVEVVEPAVVREHLARIGAELTRSYATSTFSAR